MTPAAKAVEPSRTVPCPHPHELSAWACIRALEARVKDLQGANNGWDLRYHQALEQAAKRIRDAEARAEAAEELNARRMEAILDLKAKLAEADDEIESCGGGCHHGYLSRKANKARRAQEAKP